MYFIHSEKKDQLSPGTFLSFYRRRIICVLLAMMGFVMAFSQDGKTIRIRVVSTEQQPIQHCNIELLKPDTTLLKLAISDSSGSVLFSSLKAAHYFVRVNLIGYHQLFEEIKVDMDEHLLVLHTNENALDNVTIVGRKSFIELKPDKTVINMEAGIANVGTTALEALEKLPGVTIDGDGNISLKGRSGVMVMLDGKPTYLNGAELSTLLNGMSASQISQVELMNNPPAKFDAAGNAGVINIKTKKLNQRGFQGTVTTSYGQGYYPKSNNNISLNYRTGKWNLFANYGFNLNHYFTRIDALRTYFKPDGVTIASLLEQPSFLKGKGESQTLKTGVDYSISPKTSIGVTLNGIILHREGSSNNPAKWMQPNGLIDSLVNTVSSNHTHWKSLGSNLNFRHSFSSNRELTADLDVIGYQIESDQYFENNSIIPGSYSEASRAYIPTDIRIISAKADYSDQLGDVKLEGGWKSSNIRTDNLAAYDVRRNGGWQDDLGRSNHFLYNENIHALYSTIQAKRDKISLQGGLRFEMTSYDARQLGNAVVKDSSFSRNYKSLFPTLSLSYEKDSVNTFTFVTSRRIDRPAFSKLNPFLFIINKYTYQRGNPYYRPQYTWNFEVNHLFKNLLISGISYSVTTDYFSQIFPIDSNGIVLYTEGNLGRLQNLGATIGLQLSPLKWWSFSLQTIVNRKKMQGVINQNLMANITQYNINLNNQLRFGQGWSSEISGFYNSRSQHDIQEIVDPAGQVSLGISKSVLNNQGTIKLAFRDVFYTNWMKGLTQFTNATEYFKLTRDTRAGTISFTWRFGKTFKTTKRSEGASGDEIQRVGNG